MPDLSSPPTDTRAALDSSVRAHATVDALSSLFDVADDLGMPARELEILARDAGYDIHDGHLIPGTLAVPARLAALLALAGEPMQLADLLKLMRPKRSESSVRNALIGDPRFVKTDRTSWGLSRWGITPYVPIHRQIADIIDARGSIPIDELVDAITRSYDVKEHSVRIYASTGDFATNGDVVTRRTHKYVPRKSPSKTRHLYRDGSVIRWRTTIGPVHRKGSAFNLPSALAALIDVGPGAPREFSSRLGPQSVIWVSVQARAGTIKRFVEDLDLADGEDVFLEFDGDSFDITRVPAVSSVAPRAVVGMVGRIPPKRLGASATMKIVADALWLDAGASTQDIVETLRARRESELLDAVAAVTPVLSRP